MSTVLAGQGHQMHSFEYYPSTHISRSKFNRSHSLITTMNAGYLIPIWHDFAYPGDTLILSARTLTRLATQLVPFMSNVYMDIHFWCVPVRLIWEHWTAMNGEQPNPNDSTDYLTPQITTDSTTSEATAQSIYDYFNIPVGVPNLSFNAFNFRAYNKVWNEWYRDENLQNRVTESLGDTDLASNYTLLPRGKRKDYFTGALPWPQKGQEVDLPLGTSAPVYGNNLPIPFLGVNNDSGNSYGGIISFSQKNHGLTGHDDFQSMQMKHDSTWDSTQNNWYYVPTKAQLFSSTSTSAIGSPKLTASNFVDSGIFTADLSNATAVTINSLRQAFAIQKMLEKDARGGTRYIEMILSHFGVKSPDARLQRPEFLGGATFDLQLNIVPQTSSTTASSDLGELASYGEIRGRMKRIVHSFTEHCVVFGVASIRPEYYYQQGLERDYSRRSRIDYYLPVTANLGEQAVLNKEIFAQGASVTDNGDVVDDKVFGYQERWAEMRYKQSYITGLTRSTNIVPLDQWHLGVEYATCPVLNANFIHEDGSVIDRVIATSGFNSNGTFTNTPQFISNFFFDEKWIRPMPVFSTPSMMSHF